MIENTAPYSQSLIVENTEENNSVNIDISKINNFNIKINICSKCEHVVDRDYPTCIILNKPISIVSELKNCPKGYW